jgi:hypothetical protein
MRDSVPRRRRYHCAALAAGLRATDLATFDRSRGQLREDRRETRGSSSLRREHNWSLSHRRQDQKPMMRSTWAFPTEIASIFSPAGDRALFSSREISPFQVANPTATPYIRVIELSAERLGLAADSAAD